jgi:hypothetical protein
MCVEADIVIIKILITVSHFLSLIGERDMIATIESSTSQELFTPLKSKLESAG